MAGHGADRQYRRQNGFVGSPSKQQVDSDDRQLFEASCAFQEAKLRALHARELVPQLGDLPKCLTEQR